jgi:arsenate reductase
VTTRNYDVLTIYGIPNCDTCRNARKWLDQKSVAHHFHDFRVDGLDIETLTRWADRSDWQALLNTRSLTWRKVPQAERESITMGSAISLMLVQPTLIKRPVLECDDFIAVGFSPEKFENLMLQSSD